MVLVSFFNIFGIDLKTQGLKRSALECLHRFGEIKFSAIHAIVPTKGRYYSPSGREWEKRWSGSLELLSADGMKT
jgi:hypothetical protein